MPTSAFAKTSRSLDALRLDHFDACVELVPQSIFKRRRIVRRVVAACPVNIHATLRKLQQRLCQLRGLFKRFALGHYAIRKAHCVCFLSSHRPPGEDHVQCSTQTDDCLKTDGAAVNKWNSPATAEYARCCVLLHYPEIAQQTELKCSGNRNRREPR